MKNLKTLRLARGLSQRKLARLADITNTTVSNYERGTASGTAAILERLADALECTTDELLGRVAKVAD